MEIRTTAFLVGCCWVAFQGCAPKTEVAAVSASAPVPRREALSQADFDRDEETARAAYLACAAPTAGSRSAAGAAEAEATQAAYFRAVERAMDYCRPQAELASHYFDETARAIYIDAKDVCRALREERIEADVVAVIDGGTRLLIYAGAGDRGRPQPGRDRSFRSFTNRYRVCRHNGLTHEEALAQLEGPRSR